jgi:hypothetical protein
MAVKSGPTQEDVEAQTRFYQSLGQTERYAHGSFNSASATVSGMPASERAKKRRFRFGLAKNESASDALTQSSYPGSTYALPEPA